MNQSIHIDFDQKQDISLSILALGSSNPLQR